MTIAEVFAKVTGHEIRLDEHAASLSRGRETMDGLDERTRHLEGFRWWIVGGLAVVAVEIPVALALALKFGGAKS